jgi:hypothetical protein
MHLRVESPEDPITKCHHFPETNPRPEEILSQKERITPWPDSSEEEPIYWALMAVWEQEVRAHNRVPTIRNGGESGGMRMDYARAEKFICLGEGRTIYFFFLEGTAANDHSTII